MTKNEFRVFSFLAIIVLINACLLLVLLNEKLLILFQLDFQQHKETTIVFSLLGVHSLFALLTMFLSITGQKLQYRYISIWGVIVAPVLFSIYHFKTIISYEMDSFSFFLWLLLFFYLLLKIIKKEENILRTYIRTLVNPLDFPLL
jgi:hypothetical protein